MYNVRRVQLIEYIVVRTKRCDVAALLVHERIYHTRRHIKDARGLSGDELECATLSLPSHSLAVIFRLNAGRARRWLQQRFDFDSTAVERPLGSHSTAYRESLMSQ